MKKKTINLLFLIVLFTLFLPAIVIESFLQHPRNFIAQTIFNFQILLFLIEITCRE